VGAPSLQTPRGRSPRSTLDTSVSLPILAHMGIFDRKRPQKGSDDQTEIKPIPESTQDEIVGLRANVADIAFQLGGLLPQIVKNKAGVDDLAKQIVDLMAREDGFESDLKRLTLALAEGIERQHRAELRIKATIKRARKELAERGLVDDGIEAEDQQLRLVDGEGSEAEGVPPVSGDVGEGEQAAAEDGALSLETARTLQNLRELGLSQ